MPLTFRKRRSGSKPMHWVLSILALLLALTLLTVWLVIGYHQSNPTSDTDEGDPSSSSYDEPVLDTKTCLLILNIEHNPHFILIQTNPADDRIFVASVPSSLSDPNGNQLPQLLERNGSIRVMQTVASALELPVEHYITIDDSGISDFLTELDDGISLEVPETVSYTDKSGTHYTIRAGQRKLSAGQASAILSYDGWKKRQYNDSIAENMMAAIINQYWVVDRSLQGYFGVLANVSQTDLRIDNFTAYSSALTQLAQQNAGNICTVITLDGETKSGRFIPDLDAIRRNSGLYE